MTVEALEALKRQFLERTQGQAPSLIAWQAAGAPHAEDIERIIHNLAGAAGIFGFADLNAAAARIDDRWATGDTPHAEEVEDLIRQIERLE